ncbi:SGNH/GDSL hydrolase family protein [Pseudobutyrivibrio sp.]|uniref:SGNH/GDSL hydrolase family protein n=1 Tax=Pseudobutyrivibrio sp. TaxID=2014367 RepID=UPI001D26E292|nr:SGNH/GDSL hydrolase family protein [Pseudobutyrivibrio sp.]MBE5911446.1 hypothetical protein [Pseudobutyrivibrio sp.]
MYKRVLRSAGVYVLLVAMLVPCKVTNAEEATYNVETNVDTVAEVSAEAQAVVPTEEELQAAVTAVTNEQATRQLVFIGDSRTVGMNNAVGNDGNLWSAKVGMGYSWMKNTGVPAVESNINANSDVVILMGVNDVRSTSYTSKYISYLNEKAATWKSLGANVYYVSVNPMVFETSSYPGISNSIIEAWNTAMIQGLSEDITYIDTYSQVLGQLSSRDGIHYSNSSYRTIYALVQQEIIQDKVAKEYNYAI